MFNFFKKKEQDLQIYAPVNGNCISLDDVSDRVFSSRMMGDGVAFQFEEDTLFAPVDGKIIMIATTKHAIGLMSDSGIELLLHIGLDTVNLQGKGLDVLVDVNQIITKGAPLIRINQMLMKEKSIDLTTPLIVTNGKEFSLTSNVGSDKVKVKKGECVMTCVK